MDKYEHVGYLGKGSFGCVSKIKRKEDGRILVWKEINYGEMKEKEKQLLVNEVNILQKLKHTNIVRYYDRIIDAHQTKIYIIMEYCVGGDLGQLIQKCKSDRQPIEEEVIWRTLLQILSALHEIHNRKDGVILHRDLKPGNLFLDDRGNIKLGDFGLAKILTGGAQHAQTFVGTPHYMSPEQIYSKPYNDKSDVWSVGCLIYEMATFKPPFHEAVTHNQLYDKIKQGVYDPVPNYYSKDLSDVISKMMTLDNHKRPSVHDLLHTFAPLALRYKEKKINQMYQNMKQVEDELRQRERVVVERENNLQLKEQQLLQKEQQLLQKEQQLILLLQQHQSSGKENIDQNRMNTIQQQGGQPQQKPILPSQPSQSSLLPTQQQYQQQTTSTTNYQTSFTQLKRTQTLPEFYNYNIIINLSCLSYLCDDHHHRPHYIYVDAS
ncbi:protein serine/threonine kinase [Cavenderia fasciculata]|uniref:non-specific serine/threonine protein kinase n=1 Tax=Cavenderia fasciculata TaxID=261658 RepID=F4PS00_CACFS|nr:protein serine/threonine kinase [Cavenderia fasciculata]EGG20598.1 protein serine/threonine kinase [Cavenderia fasciculata]|eukprot:XP_004358448.1 protein serine/threonine kinase [Cavenderia fasciculata]